MQVLSYFRVCFIDWTDKFKSNIRDHPFISSKTYLHNWEVEVQLRWIEALHPVKQRSEAQCVFTNDIVVYWLVCLSRPPRKLLALPEAQRSPAVHCCPHSSFKSCDWGRMAAAKRGGCGTAVPVFTPARGRLLPLILRLSSKQKPSRQCARDFPKVTKVFVFRISRVSLNCFHMQSQGWPPAIHLAKPPKWVLHMSWYPGPHMPIWPSDHPPPPQGILFFHFSFILPIVPVWIWWLAWILFLIWFSFPWFLFLCHGWAGRIIELFQFCLFTEWKHDQKVSKVIPYQCMT